MAKATAYCTCATCGAEFTRSATKYNRREADSWKEWAEENCTECPDCYNARKKAEEAEKAAVIRTYFSFQQLTGTEKQIAYANTLIDRELLRLEGNYPDFGKKILALIEKSRKNPQKLGGGFAGNYDGWLRAATNRPDLNALYTILTETSAGKIIDALK